MMFLLSKLLYYAIDPPELVLRLVVLGTALLFFGYRSGAAWVLGSVASLLLVLAIVPLGGIATGILESRFPAPAVMPVQVDGIIVLGGAVKLATSEAHQRPSLGPAGERITALVSLANRYPDAKLVFTGGSGNPFIQDDSESYWVHALLTEMGAPVDRIRFEGKSRTTHENAVLSKAVVQPQPGEVWLLVTSAVHMPRAVGAFEGADWPVVAYPVDFRTLPADQKFIRLSPFWLRQLQLMGYCLHEYIGLAYYRLEGWSKTLLPAPHDGV